MEKLHELKEWLLYLNEQDIVDFNDYIAYLLDNIKEWEVSFNQYDKKTRNEIIQDCNYLLNNNLDGLDTKYSYKIYNRRKKLRIIFDKIFD